ncbi:hypothetical protein F4809DRAFT_597960 [Biscogniauxia mediterranea]|nr:hypothetical protein F4809DRAFT_597960 [Biscogniauxia mediterranea]
MPPGTGCWCVASHLSFPMLLEPTVLGWHIQPIFEFAPERAALETRFQHPTQLARRDSRRHGFARPTDILPPLSGFASSSQKAYGSSAGSLYMAGIWRPGLCKSNSLKHGLPKVRETEIPSRFTLKTSYHRGGSYHAVLELDTARGRRGTCAIFDGLEPACDI